MKLKIWHKMIIGISIPSLIAVIGGISTYGYINDVKHRQGFVRIADDLKENVLEIRRIERNFLVYKNEEHYRTLHGAVTSLADAIGHVPAGAADTVVGENASFLDVRLGTYAGLIDRLNVNFQAETAITEKVKTEGTRLEQVVGKKSLARELSTNFILRLRLLEKNYIYFRDEESRRELNRVLMQIRNVTPFCYDCVPYIDAVHELFETYDKSARLTEELQKTGESMENISKVTAARERDKINSFITRTQQLLLVALILLCTLGPLFVYKTASYISAPIKRLSEIAKKIKEGDITLRAPLKEHDETYSLALSFNSMLDNLHQTQHSLKESLDLLNEKQAQLVESEKRASMGFLVAGIAHELNNPLNNISLRAEIVREIVNQYSNEKLTGFVQDIVTQSERAHKIINNLLDFARARKSEGMERQDIGRIVEDSLNLVDNQLRITNIKLDKEIPDSPLPVTGNRSKLEQILISIITNAIQAMKDEGTLTVRVGPDPSGTQALIRISDTGNGIPESDRKNIFEPFFTTKSPGEGTGLGLAVSHTLIKEHQGEILVESSEGEGTTFTIKLPLVE